MLGVEAERRLETAAVVGLNAPDPLICFVAPAGWAVCATAPETVDEQPLFRVPVRHNGLTRRPVAQQD